MRRTTKIEVGHHQDKVGFTMYFDDQEKEHFLFSLDIAESLANGLLKEIRDMRYLDWQMKTPGDDISVGDHAEIRLSPPQEEN